MNCNCSLLHFIKNSLNNTSNGSCCWVHRFTQSIIQPSDGFVCSGKIENIKTVATTGTKTKNLEKLKFNGNILRKAKHHFTLYRLKISKWLEMCCEIKHAWMMRAIYTYIICIFAPATEFQLWPGACARKRCVLNTFTYRFYQRQPHNATISTGQNHLNWSGRNGVKGKMDTMTPNQVTLWENVFLTQIKSMNFTCNRESFVYFASILLLSRWFAIQKDQRKHNAILLSGNITLWLWYVCYTVCEVSFFIFNSMGIALDFPLCCAQSSHFFVLVLWCTT